MMKLGENNMEWNFITLATVMECTLNVQVKSGEINKH